MRNAGDRPVRSKSEQDQDDAAIILAVEQRRPDEIDELVVKDDRNKQCAGPKQLPRLLRKRRQTAQAASKLPTYVSEPRDDPTENQCNGREQNNREPLPERHSQRPNLYKEIRQFFFDSWE